MVADGTPVKCWWCSRLSTAITATRIPTVGYPRWGMYGYFCCVPCAKAYATEHGTSCHYLKLYLQRTRGIPYATPLPTAPPWRCLKDFSPDFGMSRTSFHHGNHWEISMQGASKRICPHCGSARGPPQKQRNNSSGRLTSSRARTRCAPPPAWSRSGQPGVLRRSKARLGGSIMDYMQPVASPVLVPQSPVDGSPGILNLDPTT